MNFTKARFLPKVNIEIDELNDRVKTDPKGFVEESENRYKNDVRQVGEEILAREAEIVMLSGPSGSGKTTSAQKIAAYLKQAGAGGEVVSLDDFFHNIEDYPELENGEKDFESVYALDLDEIHRCLNELIADRYTMLPLFDFTTQSRKSERRELDLRGGKVVIIEGIHALNPLLLETVEKGKVAKLYAGLRNEYADLGKVALQTREIRIIRRIIRDNKFRSYSPERTLAVWDNIQRGEYKWIKKFKDNVDILLNTSFVYEPCVYKGYLNHLVSNGEGGEFALQLARLESGLAPFAALSEELVPKDSMIREFIG